MRSAHQVFFPVAAGFAVVAVPVWALAFLGHNPPVAGVTVLWHGHEMVFGFALAVVAGFLITKASSAAIIGLFALWLVARAAALGTDFPWQVTAAVQLAYPLGLAVVAAKPFLRAAKTWRNLAFVPVLAGFAVADLIYQLGVAGVIPGGGSRGLVLGADLIACLMFMMGGRITAAATSGAVQQQGEKLRHPAQNRLERIGLTALVLMAVSQVAGLGLVASVAAGLAGVVVCTRLFRWKIWKVIGRLEVACLHVGFVWLGFGLFAHATAGILDPAFLPTAIHGVTIGALGTFSLAIMTRTVEQRARVPIQLPGPIIAAILLISVAGMARLAADIVPAVPAMVLTSAVAWSCAFAIFLWQLVRFSRA